MVKNLINLFMAVSFLLFLSLSLAVRFLQLLQLSPHTVNIGLIMSFIGKLGLKAISKMSELCQSVGSKD